MAAKYEHRCERCGLTATLERVGRFRDEDYYELQQEYHATEQELQAAEVELQRLRWLITYLPDPPDPEPEITDDDPFGERRT